MIDKRQVMFDIERCICNVPQACMDCSHYTEVGCMESLMSEASDLLKEQEAPVKPHYNARTNWYECGACRYSMTSGMHCRSELIPAHKVGFCAKCGKAVQWDG